MDLELDVRAFVERPRVARLATVGPDGAPHLVPFVFAWLDGSCYSVVDEKPKRTQRLQRLRNLEADPRATLLFDAYDEDWARLGWVSLRGHASVVGDAAERDRAIAALRAKYPQYRDMTLDGPLLRFTPERVVRWGNLGEGD
jgi:PPOX class probable F420-dependent enzyme